MNENGYSLIKQDKYRKILEEKGYSLDGLPTYMERRHEVTVKCKKGHEKTTKLMNFINGKGCARCIRLKSYYEVREMLESEGYKVLTEEADFKYPSTDKIKYICHRGHLTETSIYHLKDGNRCSQCKGITVSIKQRKSLDDVCKMFEEENYEIIDFVEEYKNAKSKIIVKCPNDHIYITTSDRFKTGARCLNCYLENNKREGHPNWKGGISSLAEKLRKTITTWKNDSFKFNNYTCFITNIKGANMVVHHHINFKDILDEILEELNIQLFENIKDYDENTIKSIEELCLKKHYEYGLGIVMTEDVHKLFHSIYGRVNNTMEQVLEFKQDYLNGKYDDVLSA